MKKYGLQPAVGCWNRLVSIFLKSLLLIADLHNIIKTIPKCYAKENDIKAQMYHFLERIGGHRPMKCSAQQHGVKRSTWTVVYYTILIYFLIRAESMTIHHRKQWIRPKQQHARVWANQKPSTMILKNLWFHDSDEQIKIMTETPNPFSLQCTATLWSGRR